MFEEEVELDGNVSRLQSAWSRKWQNWLDRSAPHTGMRWGFASLIMLIYCLRVYLINGERQRPSRLRTRRLSNPAASAVWQGGTS